jgi:hypothetical protein
MAGRGEHRVTDIGPSGQGLQDDVAAPYIQSNAENLHPETSSFRRSCR